MKPRDYEPGETVEAPSPYAAWSVSATSDAPLRVGDLLEEPDGSLRICKYVGFEEATWVVQEVKPQAEAALNAPGN